MYWTIITVFLLVVGVASIILSLLFKDKLLDICNCGWIISAVLCLSLGISLVTVCICVPIKDRQSTSVFISQKAYIESHASSSSIEDAAITTEKIKLNSWLYNAQYAENNYSGWTFLPKEVKHLTPIN